MTKKIKDEEARLMVPPLLSSYALSVPCPVLFEDWFLLMSGTDPGKAAPAVLSCATDDRD